MKEQMKMKRQHKLQPTLRLRPYTVPRWVVRLVLVGSLCLSASYAAMAQSCVLQGTVSVSSTTGPAERLPGAGLNLTGTNEGQTPHASPELETIVTAKGHGAITSGVDERKITAALVVLRSNGTVLITVTADAQLLAEGTWKASASSPQEILVKITGGALKGEMTGSGKLFLTSDRKTVKELTINLKSSDGQEISVTFVATDSKPSAEGT
jgi:hypothetical protein